MKKETRNASILLALGLLAAPIATATDCTITCADPTFCNMYCGTDKNPVPTLCVESKLVGPCENDQYQSGNDLALLRDYYPIPYTNTYTQWTYNAATGTCSTTDWQSRTIATGTCQTYDAGVCSGG